MFSLPPSTFRGKIAPIHTSEDRNQLFQFLEPLSSSQPLWVLAELEGITRIIFFEASLGLYDSKNVTFTEKDLQNIIELGRLSTSLAIVAPVVEKPATDSKKASKNVLKSLG